MRELFFKPAEEVREPYHYKACGLENIYLLNGYEFDEHDGERYAFVHGVDGLHKVIGRHIILKRKGLTGQEVKFLRNTLNLTQSELANELGNNAQSIARWEKGQTEIPGDTEKFLRVIFFARLATDEELKELQDFICKKLAELDEIDESVTGCAQFELSGQWREKNLECAAL